MPHMRIINIVVFALGGCSDMCFAFFLAATLIIEQQECLHLGSFHVTEYVANRQTRRRKYWHFIGFL